MYEITATRFELKSRHLLVAGFTLSCALASILIGSFPLAASIATIFLFAGLHNLMEVRYFAARIPIRWGRSRTFYSVGIGGVVLLAAAYITLYFLSGNWMWSPETWAIFASSWNTAFVLWLAVLFFLRGKQRPRSDWTLAFPAAFLLASLAWMVPQYWSLALVYIHPFIAMWFLDRQIRRTRPEWLKAYHWCLASVPLFLVLLWFSLAGKPDLSQESNLFWRISQHAGSQIVPGISSHLLVATHVFLESIHYFVWILLIPLVDQKAIPWRLNTIPAFTNKAGFPRLVVLGILLSGVAVLGLWFGFAIDYTTTRDIYFALAISHVLAEFPFLIKML